jgi:tRNA nucleotidyltransferase (CCA-adding enzyme)
MQALDAAAQQKLYRDDHEKLIIMLAVICHDLGKATMTTSDARALGHEDVSVSLAKSLLCRLTDQPDLYKIVGKLVRYHMLPGQFIAENASLKAYKRLAIKLASETTLYQLLLVCLADQQGRNGSSSEPLPCDQKFYEAFSHRATQARVIHNPEPPVLQGRDFLDVLKPGPEMGKALALAYQLQIEEDITDPQELKRLALEALAQK